jgi:GH15 family glucan-1,4-alpha-glucosidase
MPSAIEDYALIGDCETAALVARDGSLDWLCLPRFDSGACFAALLGNSENGRWQIAPVGNVKVRRRYRPGTLILETEFETETGTVTLIDFMPLRSGNPEIVRIVRCDRGSVRMHMDLVMRFDYGRTVPWVTRQHDGALRAIAGPQLLVLRASVPTKGKALRTVSEFTVTAGSEATFELTYGSSHQPTPPGIDVEKSLRETDEWWCKWVLPCKYRGRFAEVVERSLITLKALTYEPTGGIVAAPTTSLPEEPGGQRNWDYRFCWLRDATFTLLALMHAGCYKEASRWGDWLARTVAGSPDQLQVLYGVAGERLIMEWEVPWLSGYLGASPVRIGNAAITQVQLDIFGELGDALHHARSLEQSNRHAHFDLQVAILRHLEKIWREPDRGIWEVRGPDKHFTHSKVMAWVAFDRAVRSAEQFGMKGPADQWRARRNEIHDAVCRLGFDAQLGSFVQSYGSKEVDASLLLLPLVGFLPHSDPRIAGTVRQIEKKLLREGFVLRYETERVEDGLPSGEGAFLACSFWLADNYKLMGRDLEARQILERLLALQNDVGLLSEEYHLKNKRLVGNFPQAFSHVALINTIINLSGETGPAHRRSRPHEKPEKEPAPSHSVPPHRVP